MYVCLGGLVAVYIRSCFVIDGIWTLQIKDVTTGAMQVNHPAYAYMIFYDKEGCMM